MDWFRVYHDIIDDPKILDLPRVYRWHVVELLAVSSRQAERGQLPSTKEIGIHLRLSTAQATKIVEVLTEAGFIDVSSDGKTMSIHGWKKRQFKSDNISARTVGWRERSRERPVNVPVNGARTETDTETEQKTPLTPRKRGKPSATANDSVLPPWLPAQNLNAWFAHRVAINHPVPTESLSAVVAKLGRFRDKGFDPLEILEASIVGGYRGLFAPDQRNGNGKPHIGPRSEQTPMTDDQVDRIKKNQRAADARLEAEVATSRPAPPRPSPAPTIAAARPADTRTPEQRKADYYASLDTEGKP